VRQKLCWNPTRKTNVWGQEDSKIDGSGAVKTDGTRNFPKRLKRKSARGQASQRPKKQAYETTHGFRRSKKNRSEKKKRGKRAYKKIGWDERKKMLKLRGRDVPMLQIRQRQDTTKRMCGKKNKRITLPGQGIVLKK